MTKQNLSAAPRSMGIDIVKIAAAVMVTCVHFFNNTAFYTSIPVTGPEFIAPISVLWIFYTCVPLFMITTGYLMKNKTLSAKYYTGIIRVAVFCLVCSTACMLYRMSGGAVGFLAQTSLLTYLFSFIFDRMFYPEFTEKYPYPEFLLRFRHFFEIQPKVYACSLLCALPVLLIYSLIAWGIRRLSARRQAKRASVQETQ